ncbi:MAG TPA: MFS transporter [Candidatus Bathyarchaeia archaeon]|nr:MFS transporter [Candidatus Bathyarchaeia archaeon]
MSHEPSVRRSTVAPGVERAQASVLGMTRYQWLVVFAAWLGWGFDVFDGLLFNYVAPVCVPDLLGLPRDALADPVARAQVTRVVGWVTTLLLIGWGTGGILFGYVTDRVGRARTLLITMLVYAVATAACAFAPNLWVLALLRFVASLGIGGEWAAGASLVAEVVPERRRVFAGALLYTSAPIGLFLATFVNDLFTKRLGAIAADPSLSWRLVFLSGLLPAAVALWIRRRVEEPEAWRAVAGGSRVRIRELFTPAHRRSTLGGLALCVVNLITWWGTNALMPLVAAFLAAEDGASASGYITYSATLFNLGGLVGTCLTIPAGEHMPRRAMFALYLAAGAGSLWLAFSPDWSSLVRMRLMFPVGLSIFGVVGAFSYYLPELFPVRLRGTGSGFCFNAGRYLAAFGPTVVAHAVAVAPTPMSAIRWVAVLPALGLLLVPLAMETRPRRMG